MAPRPWPRAETFMSCATGPTPTGPGHAIRSRRKTKRTALRGGKVVIPANAGTHHRRQLLQGNYPIALPRAAAYGSLRSHAFAGTTLLKRQEPRSRIVFAER